ncbi:hypothetical protein FACS1894189_0520 [Planctomycetales bacterium]|nr:hypothetical protein FACS1894189_0520 [Planctomycetales bacterium]
MEKQEPQSVIGVDVCKENLDCHHFPSKETKQFKNNKEGFEQFIAWAKKLKPQIVLCENTGNYERQFTMALANANVPVCAKNPLHIRLYARSLGTYARRRHGRY